MNKTNVAIAFFLPAILLFSACKKTDMADNKELYVYTAPGNEASDISSSSYIALKSSVIPAIDAGVPVFLTRPYAKDVIVSAQIDTMFLRTYDSTKKVVSPSLPVGAFKLRNNGMLKIMSGQTSSVDSLYVDIADISLIDKSKTYIIPVVITSQYPNVSTSISRRVQYIKTSFTNVTASVLTLNNASTFNSTVTQTPTSATGPSNIYLKATTNAGIPMDVDVNMVVDNNLVNVYNTANNTSYKPFPAGSYQLAKSKVTIAAGATTSKDSFEVSLSNFSVFDPANTYILPLTSNDAGVVNVDATKKTVYVIFKVVYDLFDRTKWSVVGFSSEEVVGEGPNNGRVIHMLDGDISTFWHSQWQGAAPGLPHWFVIDLGETRVLNGLRFLDRQGSSQGRPRNAKVEVSADNVNWVLAGNLTITNQNTSEQRLSFAAPTAPIRYFKVTITTTWSNNYTNLAELNAF